MRFIFRDGAQKGLKEENIVDKKITNTVVEVTMRDGVIFLFPLCNIRELKYGGNNGKEDES